MTIFGIVCLLVFFIFGVLFRRNETTFEVRSWFIDNDFVSYHFLPEYNDMLYGHLNKWTLEDWKKYVRQKRGNS